MMNKNRWMVLTLILFALQLAACAQKSATTGKIDPVKLETIEGSDFKRVVLTEKAAKRLDIQTALVRDELVARQQVVQGEIVASPSETTIVTAPSSGVLLAPSTANMPAAGEQLSGGQILFRLSPAVAPNADQSFVNLEVPGDSVLLRLLAAPGQFVEAGQSLFEVADLSEVWVRVLLSANDLDRVDRSQAAVVLSLDDDDEEIGVAAEEAEEPAEGLPEEADEADDVDVALYFGIENAERNLALGQRVRVELTLSGSGLQRKTVPFASVIYDTQGGTWVYTNPEPLVFVRQPIVIDYIEGDLAVLSDGPEAGTAVVTVGAAELFGAETGVSK